MKKIARKQNLLYVGAIGVVVFLLFLGTSRLGLQNDQNKTRESLQETVIVAESSDPYYSLAQKIAQAENLEIVGDWSRVLNLYPRFVILVASPYRLTPQRLLELGRIFNDSNYYPALGIISGSTIEKAEQLWQRKDQAHAGHNYVGGDVEETQLVYAPTLFDISDGGNRSVELSKANLIDALKNADYLYWARHTAASTWFWNSEAADWGPDDELFLWEIPQLKPAIIYTPACSNFRPWLQNSIAVRFIDRGAAAFIGHVNSPHNNFSLKHGLAVPGLSSWKGFPLGLVVQVENRVTTRTLFSLPQMFMFGDPRIYLAQELPYKISSDTIDQNGKRIIQGESGVNGILALRVENGARYDFVTVKGVTAVTENNLLYNSKLQTLNLAGDKYLSLLHSGGPFQIELLETTPLGWQLSDTLADLLDHSWVVLWLNPEIDNAPLIYALALPVFFSILMFKLLRHKRSIRDYRAVFLMAFLYAIVRLVYFLVRVDDYTVSANYVRATPVQVALGFVGVFAYAAGGLMLITDTGKVLVKAFGLLVAVLPQFLLSGFNLVFITLLNIVTPMTGMTAPWMVHYYAFWVPFSVLLIEVLIVVGLYRIVKMQALVRTWNYLTRRNLWHRPIFAR